MTHVAAFASAVVCGAFALTAASLIVFVVTLLGYGCIVLAMLLSGVVADILLGATP